MTPRSPPPALVGVRTSHSRGGANGSATTSSSDSTSPANGTGSLQPTQANGHHHHHPTASGARGSVAQSAAALYTGASAVPPPPPLSVNSGPPMQGPCVLQIITMGQERNHAADGMAHHPRIESLIKLAKDSEATWLQIGATAEALGDLERAVASYESVLRHNAYSVTAITHIANILRSKEEFKKAAEYFGRAVGITPENGDVWGALGHCYLMIDDLKKAYSSYQQALYYMPNPQEPKLWYGIGILYDRYGSLEHAEEAFSSVIRMDPTFEKANEIFFRLGIIYKQQRKSEQSLECFRYILSNPPRPLTEIDIWFQIGHVYEQQKDFIAAKESYERVLAENPAHAKVLQQLGGLYHRSRAPFYNPEISVTILTKSLESDANDPFSWYLLGRAYMTTTNFGKAYEAYQQAVYRDGKNPAFWCSIGVLYYNINQYHDALDAYSRAIRIHPYLSEVWFNLGALYESCNDQMSDAIDAYQRTLQLEPSNTIVGNRLREIREHQTNGTPLSAPPQPKDISPSSLSWTYAANMAATPGNVELSPALNRPTAAATPHSPNNGHRFEGLPPMGTRPHSADPYRGDRRLSGHGSHHSPTGEQSPRSSTHRLSGPSPAMLPQIKALQDPRGSPTIPGAADIHRRNSPLSPRTRHSESAPDHGSYLPQYAASSASFHRGSGTSDEMEWDRERTARNGSLGSANGRKSAQSQRRSPPSSSHSRDSYPYGSATAPYDRHVASPVAIRPPMDERDPRSAAPSAYLPSFHYGSVPAFDGPRRYDSRDREAAEEEERRRSSAASSVRTEGSSRNPVEASPSTATATAASAKGTKAPRAKKDEASAGAAKKESTPKSRRPKESDTPAKKERKTPAASKSDAAAKRSKSNGAKAATPAPESPRESASPRAAAASLPPPPVEPSPGPLLSREVDEDYDEQADAMILLEMAGSGSGSGSSSPPAAVREGSAAPVAPERNPRKRTIGALDNGSGGTKAEPAAADVAPEKRRKSSSVGPARPLVVPPLPPLPPLPSAAPVDEPAAPVDGEAPAMEVDGADGATATAAAEDVPVSEKSAAPSPPATVAGESVQASAAE